MYLQRKKSQLKCYIKLQTEMHFFLHRPTAFPWNINQNIIFYKGKMQNKNGI